MVMSRVGRSLPAGPATTPQASSGWSRRAWATIASTIALSMVSTAFTLPRDYATSAVAVATPVATRSVDGRQGVQQRFLEVAQVRVHAELEDAVRAGVGQHSGV